MTWWTRLGRPPHLLDTPERRRVVARWGALYIGVLLSMGALAWPHWTVGVSVLLVIVQIWQLICVRAQQDWAKRYGHDYAGGYTGMFTHNSAIRREFEVNTGSVSGFYSYYGEDKVRH